MIRKEQDARIRGYKKFQEVDVRQAKTSLWLYIATDQRCSPEESFMAKVGDQKFYGATAKDASLKASTFITSSITLEWIPTIEVSISKADRYWGSEGEEGGVGITLTRYYLAQHDKKVLKASWSTKAEDRLKASSEMYGPPAFPLPGKRDVERDKTGKMFYVFTPELWSKLNKLAKGLEEMRSLIFTRLNPTSEDFKNILGDWSVEVEA